MKILVADDDATSRLIIQTAMRSLGHVCRSVADGAQAWDAVRSHGPDVVISDWMMPGMTGLELCRSIRDHDAGRYVYFIMVSGQGRLEEVIEGISSGADDYLVKPLDLDDLQARLIGAARVIAMHRQLAQQRDEMTGLNNELMSIARHDALTGLGNRRALREDLELLEARAARYGHRYCMALIDVDHFKSYNDTYGHQAGDDALRAVAGQLKAKARSGDMLYRYGGEEFLCIFPEQTTESGTLAVERMRAGVQRLALPHVDNARGVLTVSAGLAMLHPESARSASSVLKEADDSLYRAKDRGRNRVEHVEPTAEYIDLVGAPEHVAPIAFLHPS
jgi:diguanylate cyclase (GGDEF)-like protein